MINISTLKSIFLLFLVVSGNYVGELMGCKMRSLFTNNIYIKHVAILFLIYFTVDLMEDVKHHPLYLFKKSLLIWSLFVMTTRTHYMFTIIIIINFFMLYVIDEYRIYLEENNIDNDKELLNSIQVKIEYLAYVVLIVGFIQYYIKQRKEKKDFSHLKFFFETTY